MENAKKSFSFQERFKELVGDTATQEEIAGKVNTSRQNVGNWLNGKSKPDIYALAEISKGYGVSVDWLLGLTDVKTNDTTLSGVCEYTGLNEKSLQYIENIKTLDNIRAQQNVNKKYSYMDTLNILIEAFNFNGDILLTINSMVNSDMLNDMETEDEVFEKLAEVGIGARKYFYPLTNSFECYRNYPTAGTEKTPVAQHMALRVLTLPLYADLSLEDVDRICDVILK